MQTGVSDLRKKVADLMSLISKVNTDINALKDSNDFREAENQ
jgi:archaellum component FlaC